MRTRGGDRPQRGAATQRLVLALAASALLTAAVALPMAYQAREARRADPVQTAGIEVLGTSTVRPSEGSGGAQLVATLVWSSPGDPVVAELDGATIMGAALIELQADDIVRADFRLDQGPVETDVVPPWQLRDGLPIGPDELGAGPHSVTVTVTDAAGRSEVRQAFFESSPG